MSVLSTAIGNLLSNPSTVAAGIAALAGLGNTMTAQSQAAISVNALLAQVQANPQSAAVVAAQIAAIAGVPAPVLQLVAELPTVAADRIALTELVVQIETLLNTATSTATYGRVLQQIAAAATPPAA